MDRSIDIMALGRRLAQRRAELGISIANQRLVNDGSARTVGKRALLRVRDEMVVARGDIIIFPAKY